MSNRCQVKFKREDGLDRYTDHHFGWGGWFQTKDVGRYVRAYRGIREIFGGAA